MAFDRYRAHRPVADVDLIPVMNLFVVMIPFLLLCASFLHVGVVPVSLPGAAAAEDAPDLQAATVHVEVRADGLAVRAEHPQADPAALEALAAWLPRGATQDHDGLSASLHAVRTAFPASETLVVQPVGATGWHEVIAVLDAAREITLDAGTSEARPQPLFPAVVLAAAMPEEG